MPPYRLSESHPRNPFYTENMWLLKDLARKNVIFFM